MKIIENPTTGGRRARLSPEKQQLLEKLLRGDSENGKPSSTIPRQSSPGPFSLSFAQQRLWFLDKLIPENPVYNMPTAMRLSMPVDVAVLERSINEIVRRHAILRTSFSMVDNQPVQIVSESLTLSIPVKDLTTLPANQRKEEARRLAGEEALHPFDLSQLPLVRGQLLKLDTNDHVFLLTMHHIISDGWSMRIFWRELTEIYIAAKTGRPSPLTELPVQYADYAVWQRQWLQGEVLDSQLSYWKKQLANLEELQLPTDKPRPAMQNFRGDRILVQLPGPLTEQLKASSQREGVTLFMTLLAAFKTLLHRYTGQEDLVIGTPTAGRTHTELEGLIGFFVNSLVLRSDLSGDPTFSELLRRIREVTTSAFSHQDMPFEMLVEELQPERSLSRNPIYQVTFQLVKITDPGLTFNSQQILEADHLTSIFDLSFDLWETSAGLEGWIDYDTDLFNSSTIDAMIGHFRTLLEAISSDPSQRLSQLSLLTETERRYLLEECNQTSAGAAPAQSLIELFEAQVERTPEATAVIFGDEEVSYEELNRRANQLAHYLRRQGVRREVLVGIMLERSVELVVSVLGVLKAGGAYVPLDASYPRERLRLMVEEAQLGVLLTEREEWRQYAPVVNLREVSEVLARESAENPEDRADLENLAYVIYTSGSTGRPKGVMITHQSICNHMQWMQAAFPLLESDRVLQRTSFSFDASVWEFYAPLLAGSTLVLLPPSLGHDIKELIDSINRDRVTVIQLVPSLLRLLLQDPAFATCKSLRRVFCGGEALAVELKDRLLALHNVSLINLYGPTESTIDAIFWTCKTQDDLQSVPLGTPVSNITAFALDRHLQPTPPGLFGELYLGGIGLARGYLNRADLTAEKFIPNPFSKDPGARLYRTGDVVSRGSDGTLWFHGRYDHQVKLRGFRIELAEIESVLKDYAGVTDAVVLVREGAELGKEQRLVAYVVKDTPDELTITQLRRYLREHLPDHMIPSHFVMLDEMPLTPSGKVNRRALPLPDVARPELEKTYVKPRNGVEQTLADIWARTLGLNKVGIHDNFFELGGDSILSIQIVSLANQANLHITPRQFFQNQTIAELAMVVEELPSVEAEQGTVTGEVPLTPIQHQFFERNLPEPQHYNQSLLLEVSSDLDHKRLESAVGLVLKQHDALNLRFYREVEGWRQINSAPDEEIPFQYFDLSALPENDQIKTVEITAAKLQTSLNLSTGPLARLAFFKLGHKRPSLLFWLIHHLAVDGVSWRILLDDLWTAYQQLSQIRTKLPPKTTSFMRWAQRLTEYAQSEKLLDELPYWLAFENLSITPLPLDHPHGNNSIASARSVVVSLGKEETQALLRDVPAAYRTRIDEVLLTALAQALKIWTGSSLSLIDMEGHGREDIFEGIDLSRTVGWFTSIFPVALHLESSDPGTMLKSIKEQLRQIPSHGIGFGLLRYLRDNWEIQEKFRSLPKSEILFNYLGQFGQNTASNTPISLKVATGQNRTPRGKRDYLLEIDAGIDNGLLYSQWTYDERHDSSTIESLAHSYNDALKSLIAHCQSPDAGGYTPSDFAKARLRQDDLDKLLSKITLGSGQHTDPIQE